VLQEQEFERVGGATPVRVDVRIVATTNRDLAEEVRAGNFREDLFYRLSVVPIRLPPLRERLEDIPILAQQFVTRTARETGKKITGISSDAIERLQSHTWPGNVRELSHAVERAVILAPGPMLDASAFDLGLATTSPHAPRPVGAQDTHANGNVALSTLNIAEAEQALIEAALVETNNNRTKAAELLGISVRTLRNKLNKPD
jgi:DNA-binding NtrC family response regulator